MPRTKVSKSSKRNREDGRDEKVREFESSLDEFLTAIDREGNEKVVEIDSIMTLLRQRLHAALLQMRMGDFLDMNLKQFNDWNKNKKLNNSLMSGSNSASLLNGTAKVLNPNDEGYLTEDSTNGGSAMGMCALAAYTRMSSRSSGSTQQQTTALLPMPSAQQRGRTPGPLNSARARRPRRSRSACGDYIPGSALQPKPSAMISGMLETHSSRSKMRTPMATRNKAFSAERTPRHSRTTKNASNSPAAAFFRWPKPGEMVLSQCGSPLVAQVMPDSQANVNIPVRNGVLSLRPKKLADLQTDIVKDIDPETMNQIKTLHANLNLIMKMADSQSK